MHALPYSFLLPWSTWITRFVPPSTKEMELGHLSLTSRREDPSATFTALF